MVSEMKNAAAQLDYSKKCPICGVVLDENLGDHIRRVHGDEVFKNVVLKAKESGMSDPDIGATYGITFKQLEEIITDTYGINISVLKKPKRVKYWGPRKFREETSTVWSFKQRGDWATHDGRYRGNWSPYIPRNVILKYSKPGEVVLDYFVGGGTTAVEAKLLGRRCIARDINPAAIGLTRENLNFDSKPLLENFRVYEPEVSVGDARNLSDIPDESVDLICAHPPYAGIINYSSKVEGDLSKFKIDDFLVEMGKVARESYRVLKPGGKCAILIGDTRKHKQVVPIGFRTIRVFLDAGFVLKELVVKRQHNCKTTGFWYERSIKYNFLLLAHEYLPIFEKPEQKMLGAHYCSEDDVLKCKSSIRKIKGEGRENLETTTVWILPQEKMDEEIKRNLIGRLPTSDSHYLEIIFDGVNEKIDAKPNVSPSLVYVSFPKKLEQKGINSYLRAVKKIAVEASAFLAAEGLLVIDTRDIRINGLVFPMGVSVLEQILPLSDFEIKEIVIVIPDSKNDSFKTPSNTQNLEIVHRYLLIFTLKRGKR